MSTLDVDLDRVIVWGSSAGGGLAAAIALMARDKGGPALAHQMLLCPMLDDRNDTPSSHELDREGFWDRRSNLTGLPPAFVDVGQVETFRDETLTYATRLSQSGVPVELHMWPGAWHGFAAAAPQAALSQLALAARTAYLRRVLG